jgi:hypothetical protein
VNDKHPNGRSTGTPRLPTPRRLLLAVVVFLVAVFVGYTLVARVADLKNVDAQPSVGWLVLSFVLLSAGVQLHAELWRRILADVGGGSRLRPRTAYRVWGVSLLARYVPTQLLMPITRVAMAEREAVPKSVTATSFAYEFLIGVGAAMALSLGYVLTLPQAQGTLQRLALILVPVVVLACVQPRVVDAVAERTGRRLGFEPAHVSLRPWHVAAYAFAYATSFVLLSVSIYAFARGIRPGTDLSAELLTSFPAAYVASFLAFFLPAGLGAREGAMAAVLSSAMPLSAAVAVTIGSRVLQTVVEVLFAGLWSLVCQRADRREHRAPAITSPSPPGAH